MRAPGAARRVTLPNCALSDQGGPQAGRAGPAPACWRPPAGIGRADRPRFGIARLRRPRGSAPNPDPPQRCRRGSPRRAPQGLPASPDGAKVVRPVGRSTLSPSGEAGRSGDCPTRRSAHNWLPLPALINEQPHWAAGRVAISGAYDLHVMQGRQPVQVSVNLHQRRRLAVARTVKRDHSPVVRQLAVVLCRRRLLPDVVQRPIAAN